MKCNLCNTPIPVPDDLMCKECEGEVLSSVFRKEVEMQSTIDSLRAERDELRTALQDIADYGCRHDTNPTHIIPQGTITKEWLRQYIGNWVKWCESMDSCVRQRARAALGKPSDKTPEVTDEHF